MDGECFLGVGSVHTESVCREEGNCVQLESLLKKQSRRMKSYALTLGLEGHRRMAV